MPSFERVNSGLPGFDRIVDSIRMGDNVVWQLDNLDDYRYFVQPFVRSAIRAKRKLNYIRFAEHAPLLTPRSGLKIREFDPEEGFESFTVKVHELITEEGLDAFYVFDSLSELQGAWASDLMMGNFFRVTCPYLFELNTVAFFGLLRNRHSFDAIAQIRDTTQLLLDVFSYGEDKYVQPLKVWNRYGSTMFMPHQLLNGGQDMQPLVDAVDAGRFYSMLNSKGICPVDRSLDNWDREFLSARMELAAGKESEETKRRLCGMLMGRDAKILELAELQFRVGDLVALKDRMIGTGAIGGKAVGLLISRKIVENSLPEVWGRIEAHDSYYIGADVFYTFLVRNGWWSLRLAQRSEAGFFEAAETLRKRIPEGTFPVEIREAFRRMLDYFGQSPIIVRSSSLLEDGFGNAFAGKYTSVFCVNRGTPEERLEIFEQAVREVYASAMDPSALAYRHNRSLDQLDEQMAILVQRVSGSVYGDIFMPCAAGVGYSHNSYVWNDSLDPEAGLLRMVSGLGTRAVDRTESDYPRLASLDFPRLMPIANADERGRYAQKYLDVLDLKKNRITTMELDEVAKKLPFWLKMLLCEHDEVAEARSREMGMSRDVYFCNCEKVLANSEFVRDMRSILKVLTSCYSYPVDIEFTVNFSVRGEYGINLLQCRPLQIWGRGASVEIPELPSDRVFFSMHGNTMGGGIDSEIDYVVVIDPAGYERLDLSGKYQTARVVGVLNRKLGIDGKKLMLVGPGRWGTSSPELGVPVKFVEISQVSVICEVSYEGGQVMPELSYGSHFFQDLVEAGMFYAAVFEGRDGSLFRPEIFENCRDILEEVVGSEPVMRGVVRVYGTKELGLRLKSDVLSGWTVCGIFS